MAAGLITRDVEACPDPETLAAFLDNRVDGPTRERVAAHLASCETCYFTFKEAALVTPGGATRVDSSWWTRRNAVSIAGGLAVAATLLIGVALGVMPWQAADQPQLEDLISAVGTDRLVEPRISGGFAYAPLPAMRSGRSPNLNVSPDVRIEAARLEKANSERTTHAALHARGIASLLVGDVDASTAALEQATTEDPRDAKTSSDLAAAYLVRHRRGGSAADLTNALAAANRALELDPTLPEARFNRAMALERLSQHAEARTAWEAYLEVDNESGWADEARAHLRALDTQR